MERFSCDVVIVGGGMVGLSLALALAKNTSLSMTVIETADQPLSFEPKAYQHRVSAINLSSVKFFEAIGVWRGIQHDRVSPFKEIRIGDHSGGRQVSFSANDIAEPVLGYIIENNLIQLHLQKKLQEWPSIQYLSPLTLVSYQPFSDHVILTTACHKQITAKLAIAADGADSWLREEARIPVAIHDYDEQAIVATVQTALPHQAIARQRFYHEGPLAFLPLADPHLCSIVWSLPRERAAALMAQSDDEFSAMLSAFSLGDVTLSSKRFIFPLKRKLAKQYVQDRVVLMGDAAHRLHPLAGQGVNVGFQDVMSFVDMMQQAEQSRRRFDAPTTLRRYERSRKADNAPMIYGIDCIKNIFSSQEATLSLLRSFGLEITQQWDWLRKVVIYQAI